MTAARALRGWYRTDQAPGAWPNGSRVRKAVFVSGDTHKVGALATVIGSVGPVPHLPLGCFAYFVEWDDHPGVACCVGNQAGRLELVLSVVGAESDGPDVKATVRR